MIENVALFLQDDNKTSKELLENIEISNTDESDLEEICRIMKIGFDIENIEFSKFQLLSTNANLKESVKLYDKRDNKIYGILIFSEYDINKGSPLPFLKKELSRYLSYFSQVNGFSFIIDKRLRGCNMDKKMLYYNLNYLNNFDFIWCAVDTALKSNKYWEKLGFFEILGIEEAKFYIKNIRRKDMKDIFIINEMFQNDENYYN